MNQDSSYDAQKNVLQRILRHNESTEYGQLHHFAKIHTAESFRQNIPINTYRDLEPSIERMKRGETNVLTADKLLMFNRTSGTTNRPKYIPVTQQTMTLTGSLAQRWLDGALSDFPVMDRSVLCLTSPAIEGQTSAGIHYGSVSGMIIRTLPKQIQTLMALPPMISEIEDYDLRYYLVARIALEQRISLIVTPNPTTILKLAETIDQNQAGLIRAIADGVLFHQWPSKPSEKDCDILNSLRMQITANPVRAQFLEQIFSGNHRAKLTSYWPNLRRIGCWLGGSVGYHADKLRDYTTTDVHIRDIGYLASEGSMSIPDLDETPSGRLAIKNNYYEFVPEDKLDASSGETRLCHQLISGKRYKVIITNHSGLYRYDMLDLIEVTGYSNQIPSIAFIRKTDNMLNITGEKLHTNHILSVLEKLRTQHGLSAIQCCAVPNYQHPRYEFLIQIDPLPCRSDLRDSIIPCIDGVLSDVNIEYHQKRQSKRLFPPCLHIMRPSWGNKVRRHDVAKNHRDVQFKWKLLSPEISPLDLQEIDYSIERTSDDNS